MRFYCQILYFDKILIYVHIIFGCQRFKIGILFFNIASTGLYSTNPCKNVEVGMELGQVALCFESSTRMTGFDLKKQFLSRSPQYSSLQTDLKTFMRTITIKTGSGWFFPWAACFPVADFLLQGQIPSNIIFTVWTVNYVTPRSHPDFQYL